MFHVGRLYKKGTVDYTNYYNRIIFTITFRGRNNCNRGLVLRFSHWPIIPPPQLSVQRGSG